MLKGITFPPVGILIGAACAEARVTDSVIEGRQSPVFGGRAFGNAVRPPFATTKAERAESGDPRPSLDERCGSHRPLMDAVIAAEKALSEPFLLPADADRLIPVASSSNVLLASE